MLCADTLMVLCNQLLTVLEVTNLHYISINVNTAFI